MHGGLWNQGSKVEVKWFWRVGSGWMWLEQREDKGKRKDTGATEAGWRGNLKEMENGWRMSVHFHFSFPFCFTSFGIFFFPTALFKTFVPLQPSSKIYFSLLHLFSGSPSEDCVLAARACLSQDFAEPCRKTFFLLVELYNFTAPPLQLILWWIPEPFLLPAVWSACSAPAGTSLKSCSVCAFLVCVHTGCSTSLTFQLAALWCMVLLCARFVLIGRFQLKTGS